MPPLADGHAEPDLLSSVCHDLKEPLAAILMGAGVLRRVVPPDDASARSAVEAIHRAATRMGQRISSFSDLARLEADQIRLQVQPYDLPTILQAALERLLPDATAHQVAASLAVEADLHALQLRCDRDRFVQILAHLGACALRVAPQGAGVAIQATRETTDLIRFAVVATRSPGGRGLGTALPKPELAIARRLIELHGGCLEVLGDADVLTLSFAIRGPAS